MNDIDNANRYRENHPDRIRANALVAMAIRKGELIRPDTCGKCGMPPRTDKQSIHAHHDDYTKPLDVRWLCPSCHRQFHLLLEGRPPKLVIVMPDKEYRANKEDVVLLSHRCQELTETPSYWNPPTRYRQCRNGVISDTNYCWRHK